jgi:hypothetical protein
MMGSRKISGGEKIQLKKQKKLVNDEELAARAGGSRGI